MCAADREFSLEISTAQFPRKIRQNSLIGFAATSFRG